VPKKEIKSALCERSFNTVPCGPCGEGVQRRAGAGREAVRAKIKRTSLKERKEESGRDWFM